MFPELQFKKLLIYKNEQNQPFTIDVTDDYK